MIRAGWKSLSAILVWGTLIPVWTFWVYSAWRRARYRRQDQARRSTCRLCWAEFDVEISPEACPQCGARRVACPTGGAGDLGKGDRVGL